MKNTDNISIFDKALMSPLADRMRAQILSEFIGQKHILYDNSPLKNAIIAGNVGSLIFWGPPGCGKTTLAGIIAARQGGHFEMLNATSAGVRDVKEITDAAISRFTLTGRRTYLVLDECHRWNKTQSDSILAAVEKGHITFIGSTTENPYASMTPALVSRCRVFKFLPLSKEDVRTGLDRAINSEKGYKNSALVLEEAAAEHIVNYSGGDLRTAYNALEFAANSTPKNEEGKTVITLEAAVASCQRKALSIDSQAYYDMISAFIKSMRGSDASAALFWFMRLLLAGCDPMLLCRRIMIHAAEDVGIADPMALVVAQSAVAAFERIGLPEGRIPLSEAIIYICRAKKSNSVVTAMGMAEEAAEKFPEAAVPQHLMDTNFPQETGSYAGKGYKYPHSYPGATVEQQYLPDELKDVRFYTPTGNGEDK